MKVYNRHNATNFLSYQLIDKVFTELYFLTDYSYILENHFYFVNTSGYCFKPSLSRIYCVSSSVKVLSPRYKGPSTRLFRTSSLCTFIIYRKKEISLVAKFFSRYFLRQRLSRIICPCKFPDPGIKLK